MNYDASASLAWPEVILPRWVEPPATVPFMNKVSAYESFEHLPQSYKAIFDDARASSVFFSLEWFEHLTRSIFPQTPPTLILGVESGAGIPSLALPLWRTTSGRRLTAAANYYTPLFGPVARAPKGRLEEQFGLLAQAIVSTRPAWDVMDVHPLDPDSDTFRQLVDALRDAGLWVDSYFCFSNWYLEVGNRSYHEYVDSLPSKLVNTLRRKSKQAERSGRLKINIILGGDELATGIAAYESVYNASWKVPETHPTFMPGLIRLCAEHGWLRLGIAYIDDQPAAAQVWIVNNGVASIYKLAYDQRFASLSVGSLLTARLMEHVIDVDRVREVDFLTGDDPYKRDWMSGRRERRGIITFNPRTLRGALAALRHFAARALRNIYRGLLRRGAAPTQASAGDG